MNGRLKNTRSLPPAYETWGKVMFLHLCVILFTGEKGFYIRGKALHLGEGLLRSPSENTRDTTAYGQLAGSTCPIGMLSCFKEF